MRGLWLLLVAAFLACASPSSTPEKVSPPIVSSVPTKPASAPSAAVTAPASTTAPVSKPVSYAVDLSSYDVSCTKNSDCELVQSNACSSCGCANEPIAKKEHQRFVEERAKIVCPPPVPMTGGAGCGSCIERKAVCKAKKCVAE